MNKECFKCGYHLDGYCLRPEKSVGLCRADVDILRGAGLDPTEWERYGQNEMYLYIRRKLNPKVRRIVDKDRKMVCR